MADPRPYSTPRWVKIAGIIALVLVLLGGIMLLTGVGGRHGPGHHRMSGGAGGHTQRFSVIESHTPPDGGTGYKNADRMTDAPTSAAHQGGRVG